MREEENEDSITCSLKPQHNYKKLDISWETICVEKNEIKDVKPYLS